MSSPTNFDTSYKGLKNLLNINYLLLLANFFLFFDIACSVFLKISLTEVEFKDLSKHLTAGWVFVIIIAFSIFLNFTNPLKIVNDKIFNFVLWPFLNLSNKWNEKFFLKFWIKSKAFDFHIKEYALETSNIPIWQFYLKHEQEQERKSENDKLIFTLGLLLVSSFALGIKNSIYVSIVVPYSLPLTIQYTIGGVLLGMSTTYKEHYSHRLVYGLGDKLVQEIREHNTDKLKKPTKKPDLNHC